MRQLFIKSFHGKSGKKAADKMKALSQGVTISRTDIEANTNSGLMLFSFDQISLLGAGLHGPLLSHEREGQFWLIKLISWLYDNTEMAREIISNFQKFNDITQNTKLST